MVKNEKERINRQKIVETAEVLISKYSRSDITLSEIATELGVTHAAIYKHFKNKQDLWEAVSKKWFNETVVSKIDVGNENNSKIEKLHNLLWSFVEAKRDAYNYDEMMFTLNTQYVECNPYALREILIIVYQKINVIMDWSAQGFANSELILSAFTVFTLPSFKDTWNDPDFKKKFENMWKLIQPGIRSLLVND
ncbi:Transcriptional regulator, TetR family [Leuconostoc inhae]|uniref:Transcriptional regulator, TetR family n=2 Tax=Leuconostoc TaxID=1243 RepID=A0AAN2UFX4_9LACO|nr:MULTISPECIES: TetR/AcrR family transcriptional regulator [Leuconostoc]MBZ5957912.1 TetR/AcrR family transcriptional regulator [Leuconostoc gasicomitatum]MBZ5982115.1 TetR/AcrR family transcriptional regulator [Leuconostoc gasicomitatum]MBZ5987381.1 TetR/AcrR family transcriptional regulator [Leuconostoc gasicomitatum]MBZ5989456.1 TetR/AcrR family transcriptional regulator [Leuconostoc gasicomitatum]MBZ6013863.1 TetR/AcrR family transcriptional regulator [Leuconostoc gelidum subsp. gelidum]